MKAWTPNPDSPLNLFAGIVSDMLSMFMLFEMPWAPDCIGSEGMFFVRYRVQCAGGEMRVVGKGGAEGIDS